MSNEVLSDKEKVAGGGDVNFPWKMDVGSYGTQPQVYVPCHKSSATEGRWKARRSLLKVSVVLMANHQNGHVRTHVARTVLGLISVYWFLPKSFLPTQVVFANENTKRKYLNGLNYLLPEKFYLMGTNFILQNNTHWQINLS